jgi:hypothetical protein
MRNSVPTPVAAGIIAVLVLVAAFLLWRHYFAPPALPAGMASGPDTSTAEQRRAERQDRARRTEEDEARLREKEAQMKAARGAQ